MRRQGMCRHNVSSQCVVRGAGDIANVSSQFVVSVSAKCLTQAAGALYIYIYIHTHVYYMHACMYIYIHMHITYLLCMYIHVHIVIIRYVRPKGSGLALVLHEQISLRVFHLIAM